MNPIALHAASGELIAWACGNCLRVRTSFSCSDRARELDGQRQDVERCCVCRACGATLTRERGRWYATCPSCAATENADRLARLTDPAAVAEREAARSKRLAVLQGPSPDAEVMLRTLHAGYDDDDTDLTDEQRAACRVGAEAVALMPAFDAWRERIESEQSNLMWSCCAEDLWQLVVAARAKVTL